MENVNERSESDTLIRVKTKLEKYDKCNEKDFQQKVFRALKSAGFKRLSFMSDILEDWDLSRLKGYPAIITQTGLRLDRKTDEIQFYEDLFKQLGNEKLFDFLAWAVAGEELDEYVIDKIIS